MALHCLRLRSGLRRILSISSSFLHHNPRLVPQPVSLLSLDIPAEFTRPFTSTNLLLRKTFDPDIDTLGPDTILFEGCDYNHWLITMDFPKDNPLTREQMIETYVNTAAQVFGSVEEAKKKIYALSTTTYQGFQVICSEETSEKFKAVKDVVFVLPDSYIDPVNKEYGGDKYINGEIIPRPPPVHYGRNTRRREPFQQGNSAYNHQGPRYSDGRRPPPGQGYGPPRQQGYGPSGQQGYGPPGQQNYGQPPPRDNYGQPAPRDNYGQPAPRDNYGHPAPQQNYESPQHQRNYQPWPQQSSGSSSHQSYVPPQQRSYGNPNIPPQQNHGLPDRNNDSRFVEQNQVPSFDTNRNQEYPDNYAQGPEK